MKHLHVRLDLAAMLIAVALVGTSAGFFGAGAAWSRPVVAAIFYNWYGFNDATGNWTGGYGTSHWGDSKYGSVCDTPGLGYYASLSNRTLDWQFANMERLGISVLFAVWDGSPQIDAAVLNLFRYTEAAGAPMRIALLIDSGISNQSGYQSVYAHIGNTFAAPYPNVYFQWEGRPLVVWYDQPAPATSSWFTVRRIGGVSYDWEWMRYPYPPTSTGGSTSQIVAELAYVGDPQISADGVVTVVAHYDDYHLFATSERPGYMVLSNPAAWVDEWNYVHANQARIRMVIVNSWNEYHERTAIEPSIPISTYVCQA